MKPHLHFVPRLLSNGRRLRAVANEIWSGPPNFTFYEFIEDYAINLIGDSWWIEAEHTGVSHLLKALQKDSQNFPLVIFIDLNLPFYSDDNSKINSLRQIKEAVNKR